MSPTSIYFVALLTLSAIKINEPQPNEALFWSPTSKLKWADFKAIPDNNSPHSAVTYSGILARLNYKKDSTTFIIRSYFEKNKSWVKSTLASDHLLAHEQIHFDITELYARKLKRELSTRSFLTKTVTNELKSLHALYSLRSDSLQRVYDFETSISKNPEKQLEWSERIALELKNLSAYSQDRVSAPIKKTK